MCNPRSPLQLNNRNDHKGVSYSGFAWYSLLSKCADKYIRARPLCSTLSWSRLCYIVLECRTVKLNIADSTLKECMSELFIFFKF